jgi:uncharacterized membrane protein
MAGIGFELRKLTRQDSLLGTVQAYAYAGLVGSGPWILSIVSIILIGTLSLRSTSLGPFITQFEVSVTYLIATSLLWTGFLQLAFTRFAADRLFAKEVEEILPNFVGALFLTTVSSGIIAWPVLLLLFQAESVGCRLWLGIGFVVVSDIWIATTLLSGTKQYKSIVALFALGYGIAIAGATELQRFGLEGLLAAFVIGQIVLLGGLMAVIVLNYPSRRFLAFAFLKRGAIYPSLVLVGFLYNLGVWLDKFIFWAYPPTSQAVLGPLRASVIYDIPVFLGYLSIVPGMAAFLLNMETRFAECHQRFFDAVRGGGSLSMIETARDELVLAARGGLWRLVEVQTIAGLLMAASGPAILQYMGASDLYQPLLTVNLTSAGLQLLLLAILNIFFYLDQRRVVLWLTAGFVVLNGMLTGVTLVLGPTTYGYGFAIALAVVVIVGLSVLSRKLNSLEYETFMLQ